MINKIMSTDGERSDEDHPRQSTRDSMEGELQKLHEELRNLKLQGKSTVAPNEKAPQVLYVSTDRQIRRFGGDEDIDEWISDVKSLLADRAHQTAKEKLQTVVKYTNGAARMELASRDDVETADDAFQVLRGVFGDVGSQASQKRKFFSRVQKGGETLIEYSHELIRLLQTWKGICKKDREETLISQFIEGVGDSDLRRELHRRSHEKPETFVSLRDWAVQWEKQGTSSRKADGRAQRAEVHEQGASAANSQSMSLILEALQKQGQLVTTLLTQQEEQNRTLNRLLGQQAQQSRQQSRPRWSPGCYQCGANDHFKRNCPLTQQRNLNE